jgi:hypothetical protein
MWMSQCFEKEKKVKVLFLLLLHNKFCQYSDKNYSSVKKRLRVMTEKIETTDTNTQIMYYTFRFGTSDKFVHLTQQQLDSIPYLTALVAHEDDISSIVNENGEYVLNPPIHYRQFMIIVRSITLDQPYILFTDTSEDENILDILHYVFLF